MRDWDKGALWMCVLQHFAAVASFVSITFGLSVGWKHIFQCSYFQELPWGSKILVHHLVQILWKERKKNWPVVLVYNQNGHLIQCLVVVLTARLSRLNSIGVRGGKPVRDHFLICALLLVGHGIWVGFGGIAWILIASHCPPSEAGRWKKELMTP